MHQRGLVICREVINKEFNSQGGPIQNRGTKRCLEIAMDEDGYVRLFVNQCSGQSWKIQHVISNNNAQN